MPTVEIVHWPLTDPFFTQSGVQNIACNGKDKKETGARKRNESTMVESAKEANTHL